MRKKKFTEHQLDLGMKRSQSMFALDTGLHRGLALVMVTMNTTVTPMMMMTMMTMMTAILVATHDHCDNFRSLVNNFILRLWRT